MQDAEYNLLRHIWFPIARLSDLREGAAHGNILGQELVIYRTADTVTVADRWCPHRGMALDYGQVLSEGIECPYHGWVFAPASGKCVTAPSLPPGARPPAVALRTYPAQEAHGLVWSCLADPLIPIPDLPAADSTSAGQPGAGGWDLFAGRPADLPCGLRQLTENFRDRAHFPFVHKRTVGEVAKVVDSYHVAREGWQLTWSSSLAAAKGHSGEPGPPATLRYRTVLPMFASVVIQGERGTERLVAQLATPISADGERVRQFWLVGMHHADNADENALAAAADFEEQIFREDHWILRNQFPAEAPLDPKSQSHTAADQFSIVYRRAYLEMLEFLAASRAG